MIKIKKKNKFGAKKTKYKGEIYDSKFEAEVASILDSLVSKGALLHVSRQFKISCTPYQKLASGQFSPVPKCEVTHKVDFRVMLNSGSFVLVEAKGRVTSDYRMRAKWLKHFWLPDHPDHSYLVIYNKGDFKADIHQAFSK